MSSIVMDSSSNNNNGSSNSNNPSSLGVGQLAMINDSGGGGSQHNPMDASKNHHLHHHQEVVVSYEEPGEEVVFAERSTTGQDLIATALDAANICPQDAETIEVVHAAAPLEEGIIYRNPAAVATTASSIANATSSKVHFISNLTLIAKQQQLQQSQSSAPSRTGQNIIFLNNATPNSAGAGGITNAASVLATGKASAINSPAPGTYINAFVTKGGTTTTTSGKVVNLLHAGQKVGPGPHQRLNKNVQVLKRLPVQQASVIARSGGGQLVHKPGTLQPQKSHNVVITGTAAASLLSGATIAGSGGGGGLKAISGGGVGGKFYNNPTTTTTATMKVITTANGQTKGAPVVAHKITHTKGAGHAGLAQMSSTTAQKAKGLVSKYQPKVVQVQQQQQQSNPGGGYSTMASGGGATQWRLDMRGRGAVTAVTTAADEVVLGSGEVAGIVHRPVAGSGVINMHHGSGGPATAIATSPTKILTLNSNKFAQQPVLMMSGSGKGYEAPGKAAGGGYTTHTVQVSSPGQYSVIGEDATTGGGTIKYVNAQGNVVQQQQQTVKYKTTLVGGNDSGAASVSGDQQLVHNVIQFGSGGGKKSKVQQQQQAVSEDVYYVNGTQMNDEMSARLLQSFSQKASSRYVAAQGASSTAVGVQGAGVAGGHVKYQYSAAASAAAPHNYDGLSASGYHHHSQGGGGALGQQKHGPEYFRVNTSDVQTTTTMFIDNIPLTTRLEDLQAPASLSMAAQHKDAHSDGTGVVLLANAACGGQYMGHNGEEQDQEDMMGVEMRPAPISSTDERMNALHAVLQDHTYVLQRPGDQKPGAGPVGGQAQGQISRLQFASGSPLDNKELGVALALAEVGNGPVFQHRQQRQQQPTGKCTTTDLLNAAMGLGHYQLDDDNCSVISNDSRSGRTGDNDLGEETETAPEGDGEDDSVTRCICDLVHDDGYMICCDKCSTWQHVDCMGIDRANIPEEYNCDVCQPRPMDKNRARTLQLLKRREQQHAAQMQSLALSNGGLPVGAGQYGLGGGGGLSSVPGLDSAVVYGNGTLPLGGVGVVDVPYSRNKLGGLGSPLKKTQKSQLARRKSEMGAALSVKKQKRDLLKNGGGLVGKRKEKKTMAKKRTTSFNAAKQLASTTVSAAAGGVATSGGILSSSSDEKQQGLKSWIDNYEKAMTNHYSPELRARLQAIGKQQQQQLLMSPGGGKSPFSGLSPVNLKNVGDLSGKCTTVPHAGGKILISTLEVPSNVPIVELRGKYMLSGQYKQQIATSTGPGRNQANKPPGPFIFFYRMVNDATELCVDTRTYGNDARFVRRSCRPNAEILHHQEKGTIHLYIVSLQPIRSSTEITIKHEPHDLLAVSRANVAGSSDVPQPTSTACACGLVKDCRFYNANAASALAALAAAATLEGAGKLSSKRLNGHLPKPRTTSTSRCAGGGSGADDSTGPVRRSKLNVRNSRSTSSSGESSASLMSPNIGNGTTPVPTGVMLSPPPPSNQQQLLVSGCPPSKAVDVSADGAGSLPNEEPEEAKRFKLDAELKPTNLSGLAVEPLMTIVKQELEAQLQQEQVVVEVKEEPMLLDAKDEHPQPRTERVREEKEELLLGQIKMECKAETKDVVLATTSSLLKSPDATSTPSKRNKELKSLSEENLKAPTVAAPTVAKNSSEESRKLTREERKMQAIMKAFEKMEKSSMRKQEGRKGGCGVAEASATGGKRRDSGAGQRKDADERAIFKKKKRKNSKSYQQTNQRRIRRRSQAGNDDAFTSEESSGSLLASPPISVPYTYTTSNPLLPIRPNYDLASKFNGEQNSAANMLLSLANASPAPPSPASGSGPMSSVFMLVEAAIAPLEASADFKVPKTKKSIMNDWLSADKSSGGNSPQENNERAQSSFGNLLQAAQCSAPQAGGEEPQNLCKKVEEFISQTGDHLKEEPGMESTNDNRLTVALPFPTPPSAGGSESAVKKRWLRQAISEECSDEAPASPTNGYSAATPLKKRRFARQCSDFPDELQSPSTPQQFMNSNSLVNSPGECAEDDMRGSNECVDGAATAVFLAAAVSVEEAPGRVKEEEMNEESTKEEAASVKDVEMAVTEPLDSKEVNIKESLDGRPGDMDTKDLEFERPPDPQPIEDIAQVKLEPKEECVVLEVSEAPEPVEKEIIPEEFDIEPLNPKDKEVDSELPSHKDLAPSEHVVSGEDASEIADIQKRLHSFHAENILFLKSMNKKTKPNPSPQNSECLSAYSSASVSASSSAASSPISSPKSSMADTLSRRHSTSSVMASAKRKKLDFGDEEVLRDSMDEAKSGNDSPDKRKRRTKSRFSSPIELKDLNSNTVGVMKDSVEQTSTEHALESSNKNTLNSTFKPPEISATGPSHSYFTSAGAYANPGAGHHSLMASQMAMINTSIPPPHLSYSSMFNSYGMTPGGGSDASQADPMAVGPLPVSSSRLLLSELLENAQKINHQHAFGEMGSSISGGVTSSFGSSIGDSSKSSLLRSTSVSLLSGPTQSAFYTLNSSPALSKMTFNSDSPVVAAGTVGPTVSTAAASRTLIRTASADPRLNPNLNATPETPPAPKRKLSINEYRKRMQQTPTCGSESNSSSAAASPTGGSSRDGSGTGMDSAALAVGDESRGSVKGDSQTDLMECNILDSLSDLKGDDSNSCDSSSHTEEGTKTPTEAKVTFNAEPTLLERQQESISERLKSYKSVTELLTSKDGAPIITTILQNNPLGSSIIESLRNSSSVIGEDGIEAADEAEDGNKSAATVEEEQQQDERRNTQKESEEEQREDEHGAAATFTAAAAR